MSDEKEEEGTSKVILILGGLILVAVVAMFALRSGGGPAGELAGTHIAEAEKEITVPKVEIPEVETSEIQEVKKPVLPKALRQLTPEETVESFMTAVLEERYDDAMKYVSPQNRYIKSKWDLMEYDRRILPSINTVDKMEVGIEYLDKPRTMSQATIKIHFIEGAYKTYETYGLDLQKEDGIWKIIS